MLTSQRSGSILPQNIRETSQIYTATPFLYKNKNNYKLHQSTLHIGFAIRCLVVKVRLVGDELIRLVCVFLLYHCVSHFRILSLQLVTG